MQKFFPARSPLLALESSETGPRLPCAPGGPTRATPTPIPEARHEDFCEQVSKGVSCIALSSGIRTVKRATSIPGPLQSERDGTFFCRTVFDEAKMRAWWVSRQRAALTVAVVIMAMASVTWLCYEFFRFFQQPLSIGSWRIHPGAIDFEILRAMVKAWFTGAPVYTGITGRLNTHPPASMVLLWPFYGAPDRTTAVIVWTATAVIALAALSWLGVRGSGATTAPERLFVGLLPLATYPAGAVIGNGQISIHAMTAILAALLLLRESARGWRVDLLAAALLLIALSKPSLTAPFFWMAMFSASRLSPVILVGLAYCGLTLLAATFQEAGLFELFAQFLDRAAALSVAAGESNVHRLLSRFGRSEWIGVASLAILLVHGAWVWRHRGVDLWVQIGVTGIVARFWTYHRWYDDLLILPAMVTLFRLAKCGRVPVPLNTVAGCLLACILPLMIAPGGLYLLPVPWKHFYQTAQVLTWLAILFFLAIVAWREQGGRGLEGS